MQPPTLLAACCLALLGCTAAQAADTDAAPLKLLAEGSDAEVAWGLGLAALLAYYPWALGRGARSLAREFSCGLVLSVVWNAAMTLPFVLALSINGEAALRRWLGVVAPDHVLLRALVCLLDVAAAARGLSSLSPYTALVYSAVAMWLRATVSLVVAVSLVLCGWRGHEFPKELKLCRGE
eukprot:m51a1_g10741 hypothetical protein (180) ;mRNA; f:328402-329287